MNRKMRNRKGFTLIEMMIVIAVIAILAAVLIPRAGLVQSTAKESGVESNARVVKGIVANAMPRYTAAQGATMRAALVAKLANSGMINPITNGTGISDTAASTLAVVYGTAAPAGGAAYKGTVYMLVPDSIAAGVYVYAFDKDGVQMPGYPEEVF